MFADDFNDGNDNGWTQLNRSWHVIDGRYYLDGCYGCNGVLRTGSRDGFTYTHVDDPTWTDYTLEFTFDTTNASSADNPNWANTADTHEVQVFFRVQGPLPSPSLGAPTQYRANFFSPSPTDGIGEQVEFLKYVNGSISNGVFLQTSGVILLGTNVGKIIASGGHIQIFVNNQLVLDFTDPDPIPFGGIGLGAIWEVNAWFDNVRVTPATPPNIVNNLVTFMPITSTYRTTSDTAGCPSGFVRKFSFDARLTNENSSPPISGLIAKVKTLTNGNLLGNADGGNGGVGSTLTVLKEDDYSDGILSPGEFVDVNFIICLKEKKSFTFFVDVLVIKPKQCSWAEVS